MCSITFCYPRYYYGNEDVKNDKELKDYLNELSDKGAVLSLYGRYGKVSVKSSEFNTVVDILAVFI